VELLHCYVSLCLTWKIKNWMMQFDTRLLYLMATVVLKSVIVCQAVDQD